LETVRSIAVLLLVGLSAFFSASETALFSLRPHQVHHLRNPALRSAHAVRALLDQPRRLLATILVGNTAVNVLISVLGSGLFVVWVGEDRAAAVATLVITVVVLVFGEVIPKSLSLNRPLPVALRTAPTLWLVHRGLSPVTRGIERLTDWMAAWLGRYVHHRDPALDRDEIATLVTIGWEAGAVGARTKEFVHNIVQLDERQVGEIMTPRPRLFALDVDTTLPVARQAIARAGFARVPVYAGSAENWIGYVEATELLWGGDTPDPRRLADLRHDLHFYPATKAVSELLVDMRRAGEEIAGVVDEHGALAGLVSVEDAVEQIVGEILDLHDLERLRATMLADGDLLVDAAMEIRAFNDAYGATLRDPAAETLGGLVLNHFGRIPVARDCFEAQGFRFTVEQAAPNRVLRLRLRRLQPAAPRRTS
jgi:putative hemolysin